jgi:GntR family transcriptional regulator
MFITIDEKDKRPIYQQVVDGIKALLANGALVEGNVLPPVRQIAADLGVNLNTIATAYRELQEEGLITVRHGSGATVSSSPSRKNREELKKPLRTALTQMVLAGLPHAEILNIVTQELSHLIKK